MKKIATLFFLINVQLIYCQTPCDDNFLSIGFDDSICLNHLSVDTTLFKHNIWQIGLPQKLVLDSTACHTKVIITDTSHPYPINDTSVFVIKSLVTPGVFYDCRMFQGNYYVQTDSLKDYGKMEFSPDKGVTWIDILNDTAFSSIFMWYAKPVLTGHSRTCRYFDALFGDLGSVFNLQLGDTLLFRFTFISDSIYDNSGGLMYDNFFFYDFIEGISEIHFKPIKSSIYPNPTSDIFTIEFENPLSHPFELSIYDIRSKLVLKKENIIENRIVIDAKSFKPDIYIYKLTDLKVNKRCWGKFITAK
jgi:hypothetical protein